MKRRCFVGAIACAIALGWLSGCGSLPTASKEHLPVVGLTTASIYVEYAGGWSDHRWQTPITQAIWKLVEPVSTTQDELAEARSRGYQAGYRTTSRDFANESNAGAISGATATARPRAGYALADRTNTFQSVTAASSTFSSSIYEHTAVDWVAQHLQSTHGYAQSQHTLSLGGTSDTDSQRPELILSVKASPDYVLAGDRSELLITVHNPSPKAAIDPVIHLELPAGTEIRGLEGAKRLRDHADGAQIQLRDMPSGARLTVTLQLRVDGEPLRVASAP
ncbi:hypothetical protein [Mucisphaera sp.]|uniref:hypothetical protein n=1 Tax=Mucisphaera sp. TaxID=2913024 RepID=UPI003D144F59